MYSSNVGSWISGTPIGHWRCLNTFWVYLLQVAGGSNVPSNMVPNAWHQMPSLPKMSQIGDWKQGVLLAWVNLCLASAKQACLSVGFVVHSCLVVWSTGSLTIASGWCAMILPNANLTCLAVTLACSLHQICFHSIFFFCPVTWACALINWPIQVLRLWGCFLADDIGDRPLPVHPGGFPLVDGSTLDCVETPLFEHEYARLTYLSSGH